jgi:ribonuclease HII
MGRRWSPIERELRQEYGPLLAGVDEVGRGPLAGPVVACAAVMPADKAAIRGVNDSKQLTRADRERFADRIRDQAVGLALGAASVREIERVNIYHATVLAMRRALTRLAATGVTPHYVVVDGKPVRSLGIPHRAVVHGDARCYSVACASIIAKVTRDALMRRLAARHPCYGWERNVGYGTRFHWSSLKEHGLSLHHRRAFCEDDQLELELTLGVITDDVAEALVE